MAMVVLVVIVLCFLITFLLLMSFQESTTLCNKLKQYVLTFYFILFDDLLPVLHLLHCIVNTRNGHRFRASHYVKGWASTTGRNDTTWRRTSESDLCNVIQWEEGDYTEQGKNKK